MSSFKKRNVLLIVFVVFTFLFGSLFAYEFFQVQQLKSQSITTSTTTVTLTPSTTVTTETLTTTSTVSVTSVLTVSALISSGEVLNAVMKFKGWNATEMASYVVYTQLRYLKEENGWLNIYTVDPNTAKILNFEASLSLQIPDPVVKLRGYYWYVDVNVNPKTVAPGTFPEAGVYYNFWVDAVNGTVALSP